MNKKTAFLLLLGVLSAQAQDQAQDAKIEKHLNKVYQTYNAVPTDEEEWQMLQGQLSDKVYTSQKGDTLWDISEMVFGDGNFWPKVWSLNKNILNPHDLAKGVTLSFSAGTVDQPPAVYFAQGKIERDAEPDVLADSLNVEIPPAIKDPSPVLAEIPAALPVWQFRKEGVMRMDVAHPFKAIPPAIKNLDYYVSDVSTEGDGEVTGTELALASAGEYQYVYVHLKTPGTEKKFMVVKDEGQIDGFTGTGTPLLVQVQGSVEILEVVDASKNIYRAFVTKSLNNVDIGAKLIAGSLPTYVFNEQGAAGSVSAHVIGGRFNLLRHLFGTEAVIFLDQGKKAGVAEGQVLPVFDYDTMQDEESIVKSNPRQIAKVKIVRTAEAFSTAVVLESSKEVRVGDGTSALR